MASIRSKGNTFEVRVRVNGTSVSRTFPTVEQAQRWAAGIQYGFIAPTRVRDETHATPTLKEACRRYFDEVAAHHKGAKQELYRLRALEKVSFASLPIDRVHAGQIRDFRDALQSRGLSDSTVRLNLAVLSSLFRHAREEWGVQLENPVTGIKKPKPGKARSRRLQADEEERLMSALKVCRNPWVIRVVRFCLETGMRRSEVLGLTWQHVDLEKRIVSLPDTKNGHPRWIPLTQAACDVLNGISLREARVFPLSESALTQAWGHALRRAGIEDLHLHDLRHEALSRWAHRLKGDVFKLAMISGHRSTAMLGRYIHPARAELIAATSNWD